MSLPVLSHSEVDTFVLCERRHYYAFGEKLIRKGGQSDALFRGITGHALFASFFQELKDSFNYNSALSAMEKEAAQYLNSPNASIAIEAYRLCLEFLDYYKERIEGWRVECVEGEYRLDFPDFTYAFTVDLGVWENGLKFLDFKFTYDFYDADALAILPQLPRYIGAARALGMNVRGGLYGFVRYRSLKGGPENKFLIAHINLPQARIKNSFQDLVVAADRILALKALDLETWRSRISRVSNNHICRSCSFKSLCIAELNGSDGKVERLTEYEENTRYGYQVEE